MGSFLPGRITLEVSRNLNVGSFLPGCITLEDYSIATLDHNFFAEAYKSGYKP